MKITERVDRVTSIPVFTRSQIAPAPQSCKIEVSRTGCADCVAG